MKVMYSSDFNLLVDVSLVFYIYLFQNEDKLRLNIVRKTYFDKSPSEWNKFPFAL